MAVLSKIQEIIARSPEAGRKVVVFSSFTSFFDLLGAVLMQHNIPYRRLDGKTTRDKRTAALRAFEGKGAEQGEEEVHVLLVSIKAGGTGLNLTVANNVILTEPFFNPYVHLPPLFRSLLSTCMHTKDAHSPFLHTCYLYSNTHYGHHIHTHCTHYMYASIIH